MKMMGQFMKNFYRITLLKPAGTKSHRIITMLGKYRSRNATGNPDNPLFINDIEKDIMLRNAVQNDFVDLLPDPQTLHFLTGLVEAKKRTTKENSLILFPAFLFNNLELRMAAITLIIVIALGVNPPVQYETNRKKSPFSLADTLIDSSRLENVFLEKRR